MIPHEHRSVYLEPLCCKRLRQQHIEAPTQGQMQRLIQSALHSYEQSFFADTVARLSPFVKGNLRQLIYKKEDLAADIDLQDSAGDDFGYYPIHDLKSGAGEAKISNIKKVTKRLEFLQKVGLPHDLFEEIPQRFLRQYQQQVAVESISHLQRRGETPQAYALLAIFCWVRQREITDQLVDLFIRILKDISLRAEQRVEREIWGDFIRVGGKQQLLYRLAEAMWDHPDGIIREVLYPLVGPEKLQSLVAEAKTKGTYQQSVQTKINASYTYHYRQMLPPLLSVLTFRSNNERHKPLIEALAVVADSLGDKDPFYPEGQSVPIDDVIAKQWQNWIYSNDKSGRRRIRRARYELCVLQSLRDKLRCKEIWVEGADRYRNPDLDVPPDFSEKRSEYYESLKLPVDAHDFVKRVKGQVEQALQTLNDTLPTNSAVEILEKSGGWIHLTPLSKHGVV